MTLTIVGDVHNKMQEFLQLIEDKEAVLQIGDFGFEYSVLDNLSPEKIKIGRGNHESHDLIPNYPHFLPKFGMNEHGGVKFFSIWGGFSIDYKIRLEKEMDGIWPKTWFENEECLQEELEEATRLYKELRPDLVICHESPTSIARLIGNDDILKNHGFDPKTFTSRTAEAIERCVSEHAPKVLIHGHFHLNNDHIFNGIRYICLDELTHIEIDENLNITYPVQSSKEDE